MNKGNDVVRLQHMLDAAHKIEQFMQGRNKEYVANDELLLLAILRLLEIIGEAAKSLETKTRDAYPNIPWKQITGTRDRLIHGYFDVDFNVVWSIISQDIPQLIPELNILIQELQS
ncbi:MAG: HepT-like ribonuclease domain-containing protein [bacterium]|jgi:uncharacterized protein with HEPN domain